MEIPNIFINISSFLDTNSKISLLISKKEWIAKYIPYLLILMGESEKDKMYLYDFCYKSVDAILYEFYDSNMITNIDKLHKLYNIITQQTCNIYFNRIVLSIKHLYMLALDIGSDPPFDTSYQFFDEGHNMMNRMSNICVRLRSYKYRTVCFKMVIDLLYPVDLEMYNLQNVNQLTLDYSWILDFCIYPPLSVNHLVLELDNDTIIPSINNALIGYFPARIKTLEFSRNDLPTNGVKKYFISPNHVVSFPNLSIYLVEKIIFPNEPLTVEISCHSIKEIKVHKDTIITGTHQNIIVNQY